MPVQKLINSELRYRRLFETAQDGILILDAETGLIEDVNPYLIKMLGYSRAEFVKKKLWEVGAFRDIEASQEAFEILQEKEYIRYEDLPLKTKNGRLIQVEFVSNVYLVGNEKVIQCNIRDITARKQAETALARSEKDFRDLAENSLVGIFRTNVQGEILFVNESLARMYGFHSALEMLQTNVTICYKNPEERTTLMEIVQKEGKLKNREIDVLTKIGETRNILLSATLEKEILTGMIVDISEHKQAEAALRESESKFRSYIEFSPLGVFVVDQFGRYLEVNAAGTEMLGYTEPELLQLSIPDIVAPQALEKGLQHFQEVAQDGFSTGEFLFRRKDGGQFGATVNAVRLSKNRFMSFCQEITERKLAEEKLRLSEEKYRTLVDEVNNGFYESDSAGVITFANPAMARIYGFENPEALIGKKFADFLAPEKAMVVSDAYSNAMQTGSSSKVIKGQIIKPDGTRAFIEFKPAMIVKEDRIVGTRGVVHDITERKQAEEKIRRQLEHLTALSAIDRVIAANFDLKLSLSEILTHVTAELGVDAADIMILNPHSQILEFGAECGFRTQTVRKAQVRLGESYAGRVAFERQLIQIQNLKHEPDKLFLATHLADDDFVCYYGVPLIAKGQVKGVLEVFHRAALAPDAEWFDFLNALAGQSALAIESFMLFESLQRSNSELTLAYDATIEGWSRALDLRDEETEGHTLRVTAMAVKLARAFDLSEAELVQVRWGALLHDIGKMGVPDGILLKPGPLTDEAWVKMKKHPDFAYQMLAPIRYLRLALDIPYCHHEKWDGSGYPRGLKGDQIPLLARIFAVVDVWDALSSDRPYRAAWAAEKVREHLLAGSGTHFDPQVVTAFMQLSN